MRPDKIVSANLDANETATFERALAVVKSRTYDRKYAKMGAFSGAIPISYEAGPLAESIIVQGYDSAGVAKIIADYADDLPRVDVVAVEEIVPVRPVGDHFGYSIQEARQTTAGRPLNAKRAAAAKDAIMRELNRIAFKARPTVDAKLCGLIYHPNITVALAPNNAGGTSRSWDNKTSDEILADLNGIVTSQISLTNGVETPDTIGLSPDRYALIASKRIPDTNITILKFFLENSPYVKNVYPLVEFGAVTPRPSGQGGSANLLVAYTNSEDKFTFEIPQPFEQMPAEARGLRFIVNCHARTAGIAMYYPLSVTIWEGI